MVPQSYVRLLPMEVTFCLLPNDSDEEEFLRAVGPDMVQRGGLENTETEESSVLHASASPSPEGDELSGQSEDREESGGRRQETGESDRGVEGPGGSSIEPQHPDGPSSELQDSDEESRSQDHDDAVETHRAQVRARWTGPVYPSGTPPGSRPYTPPPQIPCLHSIRFSLLINHGRLVAQRKAIDERGPTNDVYQLGRRYEARPPAFTVDVDVVTGEVDIPATASDPYAGSVWTPFLMAQFQQSVDNDEAVPSDFRHMSVNELFDLLRQIPVNRYSLFSALDGYLNMRIDDDSLSCSASVAFSSPRALSETEPSPLLSAREVEDASSAGSEISTGEPLPAADPPVVAPTQSSPLIIPSPQMRADPFAAQPLHSHDMLRMLSFTLDGSRSASTPPESPRGSGLQLDTSGIAAPNTGGLSGSLPEAAHPLSVSALSERLGHPLVARSIAPLPRTAATTRTIPSPTPPATAVLTPAGAATPSARVVDDWESDYDAMSPGHLEPGTASSSGGPSRFHDAAGHEREKDDHSPAGSG